MRWSVREVMGRQAVETSTSFARKENREKSHKMEKRAIKLEKY